MIKITEILKKEEIARIKFDQANFIEKPSPLITDLSAESIYQDLSNVIQTTFSNISNQKPINIFLIKEKVNLLIEHTRDDAGLLRLVDYHDSLENYLVIHSVNACILSLEIGRGLKYNNDELMDLGVGALLHDIGLIKVRHVLDKYRRLQKDEYEEVKNHVSYGINMLKYSVEINDKIIAVIQQHHERFDGSGYPHGLSGDDIQEYAYIVGLSDVYEALTHSRPHKDRLMPFEYETIREIISNRRLFNPYILKIFIERLTRQPAYMLWLATDGIQQILEKHSNLILAIESGKIKQNIINKRKIIIAVITLLIILAGALIFNINRQNKIIFYPLAESLYLAQNRQPLKITYDFIANPTDTYTVSLDVPGINLSKYNFFAFRARIESALGYATNKKGALKVEIENGRKERAEHYFDSLDKKWQEFRIPFSYFNKISDWPDIKRVLFSVQPWNIGGKGTIYIEDIRFFKNK